MSPARYDPIREDPAKDPLFPANMQACDFRVTYAPETGEQHLYGIAYLPSGEGPHPCVLLLHGFPGNEKNLDLAQTLRRAGCAVVQFHYRGCWASDETTPSNTFSKTSARSSACSGRQNGGPDSASIRSVWSSWGTASAVSPP